jgi:hypothetical protein
VMSFFEIGSQDSLCWLKASILLISASWVARITGVSYGAWCSLSLSLFKNIVFWEDSSTVKVLS